MANSTALLPWAIYWDPWRVMLLFHIQVKLDKKDGDGRSVQMDCYCAMIKCLNNFSPGRCACARFAVGVQ